MLFFRSIQIVDTYYNFFLTLCIIIVVDQIYYQLSINDYIVSNKYVPLNIFNLTAGAQRDGSTGLEAKAVDTVCSARRVSLFSQDV